MNQSDASPFTNSRPSVSICGCVYNLDFVRTHRAWWSFAQLLRCFGSPQDEALGPSRNLGGFLAGDDCSTRTNTRAQVRTLSSRPNDHADLSSLRRMPQKSCWRLSGGSEVRPRSTGPNLSSRVGQKISFKYCLARIERRAKSCVAPGKLLSQSIQTWNSQTGIRSAQHRDSTFPRQIYENISSELEP